MILGDLIKAYRTETHTSMEQFARKCGLSKAYVSILERNYNPVNGKPVEPSLETIKAVASAIGMELNEVLAKLDGSPPPAGIAAALGDIVTGLEVDQLEQMLRIFRHLPPRRQRQLYDYALYLSMLEGQNPLHPNYPDDDPPDD